MSPNRTERGEWLQIIFLKICLWIKCRFDVGINPDALPHMSPPCLVGSNRQRHTISKTYLKCAGGHQPARGFAPHDRSEHVVGRECGDHFAGAGGMFVDEKGDSSMKALTAQSFCDQRH